MNERFFERPIVRGVLLALYYALILLALFLLHGRGDYTSPPFVYQEF